MAEKSNKSMERRQMTGTKDRKTDKKGYKTGADDRSKRQKKRNKTAPPLVSVVVPVYNNAAYVEKCIRSVTGQTWKTLEILAIDDGSTDGSGEILERLSRKDRRIRVFHQENRGVAAARNLGIREANGTWLTFVDGDDYVAPEYIRGFLKCARRTDADMVICGASFVDESGKILRRLVPHGYERGKREEWVFRISAVWSHFYRRELWESRHVRFQTGERGEDMPIALFFGAVCRNIAVLRKAGYYYVQHESSAMHHFRGLRDYNLPYSGLELAIRKVRKYGIVNDPEFHELFVLRILATCYFDLARGASREKKRELCDYIERILQTYFPDYDRNRLTGLFSPLEVPFSQKAAVRLLILLVRTRLLYPVSCLL